MSLMRSHKADISPKVEINIVPLVDVFMVLLVIFMVTATFVKTSGVQIQLPSSSSTRAVEKAPRELVIGIEASGAFRWGNAAVSDTDLARALARDARDFGTGARVTIQGDARAAHGRVVQAMSLAQQAGFIHLIIATRQEERR